MRTSDDLLGECRPHLLTLGKSMKRCPRPLEARHFTARDPVLNQFAYRFTKLQDVMGAQLFRCFALDALLEPVESRPMLDILNLLERYGCLPSAERWQEIREVRNQIAHGYTLNPDELAATLEITFEMAGEMSAILATLQKRQPQPCP